jgi:hypothetical protein
VDAPHPNPNPSPIQFNFSFAPGQVKAATRDPISVVPAVPQSSAGCFTVRCPRLPLRHSQAAPPPHPATTPQAPPQQGNAKGELQAPRPLSDSPCKEPLIYAIDQTLPVIHVTSGNGCSVISDAPIVHRSWRLLMLLLSWIILPTAALTFSGILRETNK